MFDKVKKAVLDLIQLEQPITVRFHNGVNIGYLGWDKKPYFAQKVNQAPHYFVTVEEAWAWLEKDLEVKS